MHPRTRLFRTAVLLLFLVPVLAYGSYVLGRIIVPTGSVPGLWGLDRIDSTDTLDDSYTFQTNWPGNGPVHVYVIDTPIDRNHAEFSGLNWGIGWNFYDNDSLSNDPPSCDHGTQVSSAIVGHNVGTQKEQSDIVMHELNVGPCGDEFDGNKAIQALLTIIDWLKLHAEYPAVVNLSASVFPGSEDYQAVTEGFTELVESYGIAVVVAAGNSGMDACLRAPGNSEAVITVAASWYDKNKIPVDRVPSYSNHGPCVDLWAPGHEVELALANGGTAPGSGTSVAAPLVSGMVSNMLLQCYRLAICNLTGDINGPYGIKTILRETALSGVFDFGFGGVDIFEADTIDGSGGHCPATQDSCNGTGTNFTGQEETTDSLYRRADSPNLLLHQPGQSMPLKLPQDYTVWNLNGPQNYEYSFYLDWDQGDSMMITVDDWLSSVQVDVLKFDAGRVGDPACQPVTSGTEITCVIRFANNGNTMGGPAYGRYLIRITGLNTFNATLTVNPEYMSNTL